MFSMNLNRSTIDPTITKDLQNFFQSFHRFEYYPDNHPETEFERLCVQREWGDAKKHKFRRLFEKIYHRQSPETQLGVEEEDPIEQFFKKYEFDKFKLNRNDSLDAELERLCWVRKWGQKKVSQVCDEFQTAFSKSRQSSHNHGSGARDESNKDNYSQRWNDELITPPETLSFRRGSYISTTSYNNYRRSSRASDMMSPLELEDWGLSFSQSSPPAPAMRPLEAFFYEYSGENGYIYRSREPAVEFKELMQKVTKPEWEQLSIYDRREDCKSKDSNDPEEAKEHTPQYLKSRSYKQLRARFYEAVGEEFEEGLQRRANKAGVEPHEYVLQLLGLENERMSEEAAYAELANLNVNIYDFIEYEQEILRIEAIARVTKLEPDQLPPKPCRYPTEQILGVYCWISGRVYPLNAARDESTLKLLLKSVGDYFHIDEVHQVLERAEELIDVPGHRWKTVTFRVVAKIADWLKSGEAARKGVSSPSIYLRRWEDLFNYARTYKEEW